MTVPSRRKIADTISQGDARQRKLRDVGFDRGARGIEATEKGGDSFAIQAARMRHAIENPGDRQRSKSDEVVQGRSRKDIWPMGDPFQPFTKADIYGRRI